MHLSRFSIRSVDQQQIDDFRDLQEQTRQPGALLIEEAIDLLLQHYDHDEAECSSIADHDVS